MREKSVAEPLPEGREHWGTRLGLILAAAGNAVGIGNLLRFPGQAANNGGGAFMIPYVVSLIIFGLPMMWVAWAVGRYGGRHGHGTLPGQFHLLWRHPAAKYLGVLGVATPLIFCLYYTYIEAWCLGYAFFSLTGDYVSTPHRTVDLTSYLLEFLGNAPTHSYFPGLGTAFFLLVLTLALNVWVLYRGVVRGIELLAKIAMPILFLFCIILVVRVFSLGRMKGTVWEGLNFLWSPDLKALLQPEVWIAAAGQIFFTLSIGFGSMECYASYLRENEDIALTGLTTASTNEFVEVIFGSMIAIPATAIFFGADRLREVAGSGTFNIGMISMPEILRNTAGVEIFGTIWFLLLFFAAFTSSVAVAQPVVSFLEDELRLRREAASLLVGLLWFLGSIPVVWFLKYGVLDEMDFWAGTVGLVVCSVVEVILFTWVFGMKRAWRELHRGADIGIPSFFYGIMKYVTPVALLAVLGGWFIKAVATNALIPTPRIHWGVVDRDRFPGDFVRVAPAPEASGEIEQIEGGVKKAVTAARRDLKALAEVELDGRGKVQVKSLAADPPLREVMDGPTFERWLSLQGWGYAVRDGDRMVPAPASVTLRFEALHRTPYIWMTRVIIASVLLTFLVLIGAAWRGRAAPAPTGGEP